MTEHNRPQSTTASNLLLCNCDATFALDGAELAQALGREAPFPINTQLCRRQIATYQEALERGEPLLVACTQEAPLFREVAEDSDPGVEPAFVNIRERAGWAEQGPRALPKIAALIREAAYISKPAGVTTIESEGQCLVYGAGQQTLDVAANLANRLSVTVVLTDAGDAIPASSGAVPVHTGKIRHAKGSLGRFSVSLDRFAPAVPSSRDSLQFETPRDGFSTTCDIILDLSGEPSLFNDATGRDGYVRVDPRNPTAVAKAMFDASDLVGEFEKPLYVGYDPLICAHSRSTKIGCTNCLDNCPTGAITPNGDTILVDSAICGGCGNCSAVCPTGAISYAYPERHDLVRRIQILAETYLDAGGTEPVLLVHDESHGSGSIAMMARFGRGLPANVIPISVYSVFQIGHDVLAAALAAGFSGIVLLAPPDKPHDLPALESQAGLMRHILDALEIPGDRVTVVSERDPQAIEDVLHALQMGPSIARRTFAPVGSKREVARTALSALNETAEAPREAIALPPGAPYGRIVIDVPNCTLCLACVGACPAGALSDDSDHPRLAFTEHACVQCGLCVATCPEGVISLEPRYDFTTAGMDAVVMKEEEPFACISCGKPFGTKSAIERIVAKLEGRHAMFQTSAQIDIIKMCDDCRVITISNSGGDPMTLGERPRVRTTDDYIMEEAAAKKGGKTDDDA